MSRFGDRVELLFPALVLEPQRVVGLVHPRGDVAADDLLQSDGLAHLALELVARHPRLCERGVELGVRGQVVLLLHAGDRDLDFLIGRRHRHFLGPLLEQLLADQVLEHGLTELGRIGSVVGCLRRHRESAVELRLGDEPVVDPDHDLLDELGGKEASGRREAGEEEERLAHGGHY